MKRLSILFLFLLAVIVFGRNQCLANCTISATDPGCTMAGQAGNLWCDTGVDGTTTTPVVKACSGTGGWYTAQEYSQALTNTSTVTNGGAVTNNSTVTNNGAVTQAANFTVSGTRTLDAGGNKWTNLAAATANGDAVRYEQAVLTTGDQTVAGIKTFSAPPVISEACDASGEACNFDSVVLLNNAQTVNGVKTFSSFPITPSSSPTTDYQVANKQYVDGLVGGFQPVFIDSNTLWLDAETLSATLTDGQSVTSWKDASGTLEAFTEATNPPTFKTSIINGHPVVRFDGTNDKLTSTSNIEDFLANGAKVAFFVIRTPASFQSGGTVCTVANSVPYFAPIGAANCRTGLQINNTGAISAVGYDGTADTATGSTLSTSTNYLITYTHDGTNLGISVNGGSETTVASGSSNGGDVVRLGLDVGGTIFAEFDLAELVLVNTNITTFQKNRIKEKLRAKYNLY